jgi:CBS domain-containing protein
MPPFLISASERGMSSRTLHRDGNAKPVAEVHAIRPEDTVFDALRLMADKNIGAVLVLSGGELKGILVDSKKTAGVSAGRCLTSREGLIDCSR